MNENEFAVALFALFFVGYVLIRAIFAIPRTSGAVEVDDDEVDTTYHYDEDGQYMEDWAAFDEVNREVPNTKRVISCGACTVAIGAHSFDARCAK